MERPLGIALAVLMMMGGTVSGQTKHESAHHKHVNFTIRSVASGAWSNPATWRPARRPQDGDRVLVARGTRVTYDVESPARIRLVQVVGTLSFSRDRDTLLNVGVLKVQNSDICSESGFACDFHDATKARTSA